MPSFDHLPRSQNVTLIPKLYNPDLKAFYLSRDERVLSQAPVASETAITDMITKRRLICSVELKEAFGIQDVLLMEMLERMRDADKVEMYPVKNEWYIKVRT